MESQSWDVSIDLSSFTALHPFKSQALPVVWSQQELFDASGLETLEHMQEKLQAELIEQNRIVASGTLTSFINGM